MQKFTSNTVLQKTSIVKITTIMVNFVMVDGSESGKLMLNSQNMFLDNVFVSYLATLKVQSSLYFGEK